MGAYLGGAPFILDWIFINTIIKIFKFILFFAKVIADDYVVGATVKTSDYASLMEGNLL